MKCQESKVSKVKKKDYAKTHHDSRVPFQDRSGWQSLDARDIRDVRAYHKERSRTGVN